MNYKFKTIVVMTCLILLMHGLHAQYSGIINLTMADLSLQQKDEWDVAILNSCYMETEIGKPYLPVKHINIAIPVDKVITRIEILDIIKQELPGNYNIMPTQPDQIPGEPEPAFTDPIPWIYGTNAIYPDNVIYSTTSGFKSGVNIAGLLYYPLTYNPVTQKLYLTTRLEYRLIYANQESYSIKPNRLTVKSFNNLKNDIKNLTVNPVDVDTYLTPGKLDASSGVAFSPTEYPDYNGQPVEYVIITNETMAEGFQEIAEWKTLKGTPAVVRTVEWINIFYPGADLAQKVRNFIIDAYQNWGTLYIMLGGDSEVIPVRYAWVSHYGSIQNLFPNGLFIPADMYYACLDGNWNADGDATYGEANWDRQNDGSFEQNQNQYANLDDVDRLPEVYLGRIPVEDMEELNRWKAKYFEYVKTSQGNENNCLLFSSMGSINSLKNAFPSYISFTERYNPIYNNMDVLNEFNGTSNKSHHIICGLGHGGPTSFAAANGSLYRSDMDNLINQDRSQILYLANHCSTMPWEYNTVTEHYLGSENGGVSVIANTAVGWSSMVGSYNNPFIDNIYNTNSIIGNAFNQIKTIYNNYSFKDCSSRLIFFSLSISSDPEMPVWTNNPQILTATNPTQVYTGEQTIGITINSLAANVVATVCLYKENEVYRVDEITGTGTPMVINLDCIPDTPGIIALTITAHNYIPVERTINVVVKPGTHLFLSGNLINDDVGAPSHGNGNGTIDAGETIELTSIVSNQGMTAANSVTAGLSITSSSVTVTQANSSFGTINALGNNPCSPAYVVQVSPNTPDHEMVELNYTILASNGTVFNDKYSVEIHAPLPKLTVTALTTTINNDNIIDPGDHVSLIFNFYNAGSGVASDLTGTLNSTSPYIQNITASTKSFGSIQPYLTGSNTSPFEFNITSAYNGQSIELTLTLVAGLGSQWVFPINLDFPPVITNLDYTSTNNTISPFWSPIAVAKGYNLYRSDQANGIFTRLNDQIIEGFSGYCDYNLPELTTFYYKVRAVSQSGIEGPFSALLTAWTTLPYHADWPMTDINVDVFGGRSEGSPVTCDVDTDGTKEIFFVTSDADGTKGGIFGFHHDMEELYDIDFNPTTVSGFYEYNLAGSMCLPAIGDINEDGIQEIITTTKSGSTTTDQRKVIVHSTLDLNSNGKPDLLWSQNIGGPGSRGACLSDLNNDGYLEILTKSDWGSSFQVLTSDEANLPNLISYPGWPVNLGKDGFTMPAACDLDNNGFKEVVFGCKDGIYIFNHDGTPFLSTSNDGMFFNHSNGSIADHMDSAPVFIDLNNDGYYEMVWVSGRVSSPCQGRVFALDRNGDFVSGWKYDDHIINIMNMGDGILWLPIPSAGIIEYNGHNKIILTIAEQGKIYCWDQEGATLSNFPISVTGLESKFNSPLIADIDDDDDLELIVSSNSSNGGIYAFNFDVSPVVGWPLRVKSFSTPHISDIDNDGKNEIISTADMVCHVWKTEGDADKIEWGSFRKDSYNSGIYDNICRSDDEPVSIESNTIWDSDRKLYGNIHVEMGATFTIKSKVEMPANSKIIIKRGGKLVLDGGVITSNEACSSQWRGIEVWGNSNVAQIPTANQGLVQIINGGILENAECGIRTYKPYALPDGSESITADVNYCGGIVKADGAVFRNNKTAVEFLPYEYQNYSYLKNCTFETTTALLDGSLPDYFVKLSSVTGVSITGSRFVNSYNGYANVIERGGGIYASDADVLVDHFCNGGTLPCKDFTRCLFSGLYRGIYALGAEKQRIVKIQNTDFSTTVRGIYLSSLDFTEVNLNNFQVWNEVVGLNPQGYSLYMDASTGFTIEENRFTNPETSRRGIGLIVNESGADNNQVYNNYFEKLNYATIAQGYNRSGATGTTGLCYKCNDFVNNDNDIRLARRNSNILTQQDGIAYYQGKNEPGNHLAPAGNIFTSVTNTKDISNSCNWIVYYRHNYGPASLLPVPADLTTNYQVFGTTYTKSISCPTHLGTGTEKSEVKAALATATTGAEATQTTLDAVIDGGATAELQSEVVASIPEEGLELRDQLLTESPYLSDTVLKTSIAKEDVLNNAMIRDVMVANPQSAKSAQMVEMLDERVNPMTDEMRNEILAGQTITSEKDNLEAALSFLKQEAWFNFGNLCRLYANDTLHTWSSDTIGELFAGETTLESRYKLAFWHWFKGNPASATQVLGSIPAAFTLDASGLAQYERYSLLLNTLIQLATDPEAVLEAGTDIVHTLNQLSTLSEDKPAAMSRNLLISAGLLSYDEPIKLDDELKSMPVYNPDSKIVESSKLRLYPNPASDFITFSWNTPGRNKLLLTITDAAGRTVYTQSLKGRNNEAILNIAGFANGTYQVCLSTGNAAIATETLVIQK